MQIGQIRVTFDAQLFPFAFVLLQINIPRPSDFLTGYFGMASFFFGFFRRGWHCYHLAA